MANLLEFQEYGVDHKARQLNGTGALQQAAPFFGSLQVGKPSNIASHLKEDQDRANFHAKARNDVFQHRAANLGLGAGNDSFSAVAALPGAVGVSRGPKFKFFG